MPSANFLQAFYAQLDAGTGTTPVSPELRRQGDATPAIVYEVTETTFDIAVDGLPTQTGTATVRMDCVADKADTAYTLARTALAAVDGKWTQSTVTAVMVSASISQSRATPDDGQEDAERIASLTCEFQWKET